MRIKSHRDYKVQPVLEGKRSRSLVASHFENRVFLRSDVCLDSLIPVSHFVNHLKLNATRFGPGSLHMSNLMR